MAGQKSRAALLDFIDYLSRKGLMNKTTASARKAAANNVLGILDEQEAGDISSIDLDEVMLRFQNLNGMKYTADSLTTYKSRVRSAIDDFLSYVENPMAFKPSTSLNRKAQDRTRATDGKASKDRSPMRAPNAALESASPPLVASLVLPIPIRADLTVYVQGLPYDLTQGEALKIANVIRAMAVGD
ncbi:hypothetical protein [Neorhizobium sp. NCHU2750]|uniref:hypothetical protein n=1 Tax=Neorhizobium sp. NCHU2750 TaxID=1825976 RepID=UPI000E75F716|nr:hypothetical protein NCHU2750_40110 [Neorhizobium sp. NCHU2750]